MSKFTLFILSVLMSFSAMAQMSKSIELTGVLVRECYIVAEYTTTISEGERTLAQNNENELFRPGDDLSGSEPLVQTIAGAIWKTKPTNCEEVVE